MKTLTRKQTKLVAAVLSLIMTASVFLNLGTPSVNADSTYILNRLSFEADGFHLTNGGSMTFPTNPRIGATFDNGDPGNRVEKISTCLYNNLVNGEPNDYFVRELEPGKTYYGSIEIKNTSGDDHDIDYYQLKKTDVTIDILDYETQVVGIYPGEDYGKDKVHIYYSVKIPPLPDYYLEGLTYSFECFEEHSDAWIPQGADGSLTWKNNAVPGEGAYASDWSVLYIDQDMTQILTDEPVEGETYYLSMNVTKDQEYNKKIDLLGSIDNSKISLTVDGYVISYLGKKATEQSGVNGVSLNFRAKKVDPTDIHNITVADNIQHGQIAVSPLSAIENTEITVTATPDEGYKLDSITAVYDGNKTLSVKDGKFLMPAADVTVSAKFIPQSSYNVWLGSTEINSVNKDDVFGDGKASYDPATCTLTLDNPTIPDLYNNDGSTYNIYAFGNLKVKGSVSLSGAKYGIFSQTGDLVFEDADIEVASSGIAICSNIYNVSITRGRISAKSTGETAIDADRTFTTNNSEVTATGGTYGIKTYESIKISGGNVTTTGGRYGIYGHGGVQVENGAVLTAKGTGNNGCGIYDNSGVGTKFTDSKVILSGTEYGIRCGSLTCNNSNLLTEGGKNGIYATSNTSFGNSVVTAKGGTDCGIQSVNLSITGGQTDATGSQYGIYAGGSSDSQTVMIRKAIVTAEGRCAIRSEKLLNIRDSEVNAKGILTGDVQIRNNNDYKADKASSYGIQAENGIHIGNSTVSATADNDAAVKISYNRYTIGVNTFGLYVSGNATITDSTTDFKGTGKTDITLGSGCDASEKTFAIYVNGNFTINTSTVRLSGTNLTDGTYYLSGTLTLNEVSVTFPIMDTQIIGNYVYDANGTTKPLVLSFGDKRYYRTVTYKVENGTWADGTTEPKTEKVREDKYPMRVPTGMIASEGYCEGTWGLDPSEQAIAVDTTFTYTFTEEKTLTVHWSSVDGLDVMEPIVIKVPKGATVVDAVATIGKEYGGIDSKDYFTKEGYIEADTIFNKNPISDYEDMEGIDAGRILPTTVINEDTEVYALMLKAIGEAPDVTIGIPACGTKVTTEGGTDPVQTNAPKITVPSGKHYEFSEDEQDAWWTNLPGGNGTIEGGKTYNSMIWLTAEFGYYFDQELTEVTNAEIVDNGLPGGWLYDVLVKVTAAHVESEPANENNEDPTCTEDGSYDIVVRCTACDAILSSEHKTVDAKGHDWSKPTYAWSKDNSEVTATRSCSVCSEVETETVKTTSSVTKEPTVDEAGIRTFTATFTNKAFAELERDVEIPKLGPTPSPTAEPTKPADPTAKPTDKPAEPTAKPTEKPAAVSLTLDKKEATLVCGKDLTLKATLKGSKDKITWKTSDKKVATVDANGKITAKMAGAVTITASAAGKKAECKITVLYKDVTNSKDFWYAPTNYLTAKGVVKGYANQTEFRPANNCTRAQMVTFIWRLQGEPKPKATTCKFKDVKKTDYFYKACIWGNENHIVEGYKDGTFGPQIVCARKHAVTFLWRLAGKPAPASTKNKFKDVKTSDYFYKATLWASEKKILAGYDDGTFKPDGDCLRRQMVTFLYKYDKYVNKKG